VTSSSTSNSPPGNSGTAKIFRTSRTSSAGTVVAAVIPVPHHSSLSVSGDGAPWCARRTTVHIMVGQAGHLAAQHPDLMTQHTHLDRVGALTALAA
jgi:hypothetical protein